MPATQWLNDIVGKQPELARWSKVTGASGLFRLHIKDSKLVILVKTPLEKPGTLVTLPGAVFRLAHESGKPYGRPLTVKGASDWQKKWSRAVQKLLTLSRTLRESTDTRELLGYLEDLSAVLYGLREGRPF